MKNREVVERILAYHPNLPNYDGCDNWKCGDPEAECTGIVTALVPTVNVIRETARLGANLLIVHEPTFYTSQDGPGWFEDFPTRSMKRRKSCWMRPELPFGETMTICIATTPTAFLPAC